MLPLPAGKVAGIAARLENVAFERLYGAFEGQDIAARAREIVMGSVQKYIACLNSGPVGKLKNRDLDHACNNHKKK